MKIQVVTFMSSEPEARTIIKSIEWNNSSDRRWLMNHLHHCMNNRKGVVISPESN
jgi:hypothetical protein